MADHAESRAIMGVVFKNHKSSTDFGLIFRADPGFCKGEDLHACRGGDHNEVYQI